MIWSRGVGPIVASDSVGEYWCPVCVYGKLSDVDQSINRRTLARFRSNRDCEGADECWNQSC